MLVKDFIALVIEAPPNYKIHLLTRRPDEDIDNEYNVLESSIDCLIINEARRTVLINQDTILDCGRDPLYEVLLCQKGKKS